MSELCPDCGHADHTDDVCLETVPCKNCPFGPGHFDACACLGPEPANATTYSTPFKGDQIALHDGLSWRVVGTETSVPIIPGVEYDVFADGRIVPHPAH